MLDNHTAAEIARILRDLVNNPHPPMTGALSLLEENTMKWADVHPELGTIQHEFRDARARWWPGDPRRDTPEALLRVRHAASALAGALVSYGSETLPLCGHPSVFGPSCRAVVLDGECTYGTMAHPEETPDA